ncbi:MAG TPA: DsbE family thiol:disulfide interchange protein [Steroidobacteraceae bacterium]|nr:DsbE family thiol:disulfide interchange protein [Steroidobacteraceae bacterium]
MKRFLLPLGVFTLLVIVLAVGIYNAPKNGSKEIVSPLLGKSAPQFRLPQLANSAAQFENTALLGGWHLVNVWGTWCPQCRVEHDTLLQIKAEGRVPIIGIDWKDEDSVAMDWLSQLGNPYSVVATDHDGRVAIDWGVYGAPESFLVNPQGIVVEKLIGAMTMEDWNNRFLPHLAAGTPASAKAGT